MRYALQDSQTGRYFATRDRFGRVLTDDRPFTDYATLDAAMDDREHLLVVGGVLFEAVEVQG